MDRVIANTLSREVSSTVRRFEDQGKVFVCKQISLFACDNFEDQVDNKLSKDVN